jgi:ribonuclease J
MEALRSLANDSLDYCRSRHVKDHATIKAAIKNDLSAFLYKTTKKNPMILPILIEL